MISNIQPSIQNNSESVLLSGRHFSFSIKIFPFAIYLILIFLTGIIQPGFAQQQKIDSLIADLQATKMDTTKAKLLHRISIEYLSAKSGKAFYYAKQGLALSEKIEFKVGQSICLNALGRAYNLNGKFDSAMVCFEKRLVLVKEMKDSIGIAAVYLNMGGIFYRYGDHKKAIGLFEKANLIYASRNEKSLLAKGYHNIGNIYLQKAEYSAALDYYLKACTLYGEVKNERDICITLINISNIYMNLKQYEKAKQSALDAKAKSAFANDLQGVGTALYTLSVIYNMEGDIGNKIKYLNEAKAIFGETQAKYYQTIVNQALGVSYLKLGENEKALEYFNAALPLAQKMGDKRLISSLYGSIGMAYTNTGDFLKALEYMRKSEKLFNEINDKNSGLEISENFIVLFARMNQPDSVATYFKRYQILSDTIFNERNSKSIAEIQTKYETEKKDKEIIALNLESQQKKNNILKLQNTNEITNLKLQTSTIENEKNIQSLKLTKAEQEKQQAKIEIYKLNEEKQLQLIKGEIKNKRLITFSFILGLIVVSAIAFLSFLNFKNRKKKEQAILNQRTAELSRKVIENDMKALRSQMNPHFIFNCVDSIERLLDNAKIKESKISLSNFSNLTRTILENSMKREIPLNEEVQTLQMYMELENIRFQNHFTFDFLIQSDIDTKTTLIPPLILQPFVENSIKHGFRNPEKSGHLTIEILKENDTLVCVVEDNGVGRKQPLNLKPLSGFKKESIGMKLTNERLQLISEMKNTKSYFLIDDLEDTFNKPRGTRVKMFLPYELSV